MMLGMEIVVLFIVLLAAMLWGAVALFDQSRKEAEGRAPQILDEAFDGKEAVSFTVSAGTLPFEQVVAGALERGYRLQAQSGRDSYGTQTLVFSKDSSPS